MQASDLVPYKPDQIVKALEQKSICFVADVLHGVDHFPALYSIKYQLDELPKAIQRVEGKSHEQIECELIAGMHSGNYPSLLHQEFGLLMRVRDSSTMLNWMYVKYALDSLPLAEQQRIERAAEERRAYWLKKSNSHNKADSHAFAEKIGYFSQEENRERTLGMARDKPELMGQIEKFYQHLFTCAEFQSKPGLPQYKKNEPLLRINAYYWFDELFQTEVGPDIYQRCPELEAILKIEMDRMNSQD